MMLRIHGLTLSALLLAVVPMAAAGSLSSVTVTPSTSQVGQSAIYTLSLTTSSLGNGTDAGIPKDGKIIVTFPAGFNLLGVNNASPANGNMTGDFSSASSLGNVVTLVRDGTGNDVGGDTNVAIDFEFVINATVAGSYQLTVETRTAADISIDNGTSANFSLTPGALDHFIFATISSPQSAGSAFSVTITAKDAFDNTITTFSGAGSTADLTANTGAGTISPTNTGGFTNGVWTGNVSISKSQAGVVITATSGIVSDPSNAFTVNHGALDHFTFNSISTPQTAGVVFSVTITARDAFGNTVTSFTGAGSTASLTANTGAGTISPTNTGAFTNGVWTSAGVMLTKSQAGVIITAMSGIVSGQSNAVTVNAGALDHFAFSPIGPQTAGVPFSITISARDSFDNTVTSFVSTAALSNMTISISPTTTTAFIAGVWTGNVTISTSQTGDVITASSAGKQGQSAPFNVSSGALHHFTFVPIGGPQTAGTGFQITIRAMDALNNIVTGFTGTAQLTDNTTSISPATTGAFTAGAWTGFVSITKSQIGVVITATSGIVTGQSNAFNVSSAALDHFIFDAIANQITGAQFSVTITAKDFYENTVTSFISTALLSDVSGTIAPTTTGAFTAGVWTGSNIVITKSQLANTITVIGGGKQGTSNLFDVIPQLHHFDFSTIPSPRTAGASFSMTITAKDAFNNTVTSFSGIAQLTDDTNTISPATTGNFTAGAWTGDAAITKSQSNIRIYASASGKTGQSNLFTVNSAALNNFSFSPIASPQIAGKKFFVTITARDVYANTVAGFVSTVTLSEPNNTITPAVTGNFVNGARSDSVSITKSQFGITITATQGAVSSPSNAFDVSPASLGRFVFGSIPSPQTAGTPFPVSITILDAYDNIVTAYADSVTLSDPFNTIAPKKIGGFINGAWTDNVTLTKADAATVITASASGQSDPSNAFQVVHAALNSYSISAIGDQTAGTNFSISITAQDPYLNTVQSFVGAVGLQDSTGTINPTSSDAFSGGMWTGSVTITKSKLTRITANAFGAIGRSNAFFINPAALHHFTIDSVGNQMAGVPFPITIRARDTHENVVTSFASNVNLNDLTGSILPKQIDGFQSGKWTGEVIIIEPVATNQISAARTGGSEGGSSNNFSLIPYLNILSIDASPAKVNQGQQGNVVTMVIENSGGTTIAINSAALTFTGPPPVNANRTAQYVVTRTDNVTSIAPATTQTLTFSVNVSLSASLELITIDGNVSGTWLGSTVVDNSSAVTDQWQVQSPAALSITSITASVDTVSLGQSGLHVIMRVANSGTADAQVTSMGLRFRVDTQNVTAFYGIVAPSGGILPGGTNNDFDIVVDVSSTTPLGSTVIDGVIFARDVNTNAVVADSSATSTDLWKVIEAPIIAFVSITVPSPATVTAQQTRSWTVTMTVANNGGSDVRLDSTRLSLIIGSDVTSQYNIIRPDVFTNSQTNILASNGAQDQLQFIITAGASTQTTGLAAIQGFLYLTDQSTGEPLDTQVSSIGQASVRIQSPAVVDITSIQPSQPRVNSGQTQDWEVTVKLSNNGQSNVQIDTVAAATKISFSSATDFVVLYKSFSGDPNLILRGNSTADLVYTVDMSSNQIGENVISAQVAWVESNSGRREVTSGQGQSVIVQTPAQLRIDQTQASSADVFAGSPFEVTVTVRNLGQESARNLSVDLVSNGNSLFVTPQTKPNLAGGAVVVFTFDVQANALAVSQETFTAAILQGTGDNTNAPVAIVTALDSTAVVNIESNLLNSNTIISSPNTALDGVVSTGQAFRFVTQVIFAPDQIDNVQATLSLPPGYTTTGSLIRQISATGDTVHWNIVAPQSGDPNPVEISVQAEGKNANNQTIAPSPDIISMRTIERPKLRVVSQVSQPPGARSVMVGQQFTVQAEMENDGEAAVAGSAAVRLSFESSAFTTADNLVQTFTVGAPASWTIQAPSQATVASRIYCVMSTNNLPADENGAPSLVVEDSSAVMVTTISDTVLSFSNYPNPFGSPARGKSTTLYYYLQKDTDVHIRIFSLLGELVWERSFKTTDPEGKSGPRSEVLWNAENGNGNPVLNGVYIAYLTTGDGQQATRKIAVVK